MVDTTRQPRQGNEKHKFELSRAWKSSNGLSPFLISKGKEARCCFLDRDKTENNKNYHHAKKTGNGGLYSG